MRLVYRRMNDANETLKTNMGQKQQRKLEVGSFGPDQLREYVFPHDAAIVAAWRGSRSAAATRGIP